MNKCPKCGNLTDGKFCPECGALTAPVVEPVRQPEPTPMPNPTYAAPVVINNNAAIPENYKPLGAWTYFALGLLYSIPIVGFIFLIIHSCSSANLNRRGYARSYWCWLIVAAAVFVVFLIIMLIVGTSFTDVFKSWK